MVHVSFAADPQDPFPTILPMIGVMGSFDHPSAELDEPLDCYLHGYVSSRIMRLGQEKSSNGGDGLPVCVEATKVDGLVLSLTPFSHSYNYRSAVLHGYATVVTSDEEKIWAMKMITNSVVPNRYHEGNTRVPPEKVEMSATNILRIRVVDGSGKVRQGMPHDDKKDLDREDLVHGIWTGVLPVWEKFEEPIPGPYNKLGSPPEHVKGYVDHMNQVNKQCSIQATKEP